MIKQIKHEHSFISLMTELANINPQLIFNNEDGLVSTKAMENQEKSICYFLNAPIDYFGFESESLAVIDFKRLVSYYNTFTTAGKTETEDLPTLSVEYNNDNAVIMYIKSDKTKSSFKHRLASEDVIVKPRFNKIKFKSVDAKLVLTEDQVVEIDKMMRLTSADRIKWGYEGDTCNLTLFNTRTNDTWENKYLLSEEASKTFEMTTMAKGFGFLPTGGYNIEVSVEGIMSFEQKREDDISLVLYIAKTGG